MSQKNQSLPAKLLPENLPTPETLIPTKKIIELAQRLGVDFGTGNAEERIRYYIKLGLLPNALRRATPESPNATAGHLPFSAVASLRVINRYKQKGLSYPQISEKFKKTAKRKQGQALSTLPVPPTASPIVINTYTPNKLQPVRQFALVNRSGITAAEVEKKLAHHQAEMERKIEEKLASTTVIASDSEQKNGFAKRNGSIASAAKQSPVPVIPASSPVIPDSSPVIPNPLPVIPAKAGIQKEEFRFAKSAGDWIPNRPAAERGPHAIALSLRKGTVYQVGNDKVDVAISESDLHTLTKYHRQDQGPTLQGSPDRKVRPFTGASQAETLEEQSKAYPPYPTKKLITLAALSTIVAFILFASINIKNIGTQLGQSAKNQAAGQKISTQLAENLDKVGNVLAASSTANLLYIDATTQVKGEVTFEDNITAPNVVYGVTGGTGISVTTGQNPVVSLDSAELVTSVNSISGALSIAAGSNTTVSTSGSTITISSSSSSSSSTSGVTSITAGTGLTGGGSTSTVSLALAIVPVTLGGLGAAVAPAGAGELLYSSSATIFTTLAAGVADQCLLSGGAAAPTWGSCDAGGGVTSVTGTANQITASPTTGDVILTLPVAITAPGSLTTTTTLTATTDFNVNGNTTIGNATTDRLTVTSQILGASPLVFQGLTDDTITTTLAVTDPTTPSKTITLPNATGTVAVSATSPVTLSALGDIGCTACLTSSSGVTTAAGTANEILVNGGTAAVSGAITLSLPSAITAPGSLTTTTTLTATTDFTVNGNTLIGNATSDTVSIFPTTLAFAKENAHTIQITDSTTADTAGAALTILGAAGAATNAAGGAISVVGGAGAGTGAGGALVYTGGASGAGATGNGGAVTVTGGAALSTDGTGGAISLVTGAGNGTGLSGAVSILTGAADSGAATGVINITTGNATSAASGATTISTGTTTTSGTTGILTLSSGASAAASGAVSLVSGTATTSSASGSVNILSGTSGTGTTGAISILSGNATGAGTSGNVIIDVGTVVGGTLGTISIGATSATTVSIGNSGTTVLINSGTPAANGIPYSTDTSGTIAYTATGGAGTKCLTSADGGTPAWGSCGGSALTPWTSDIDADGFNLLDLGASGGGITFRLELPHTIQIADSTTADTAGGALTIKGAAGAATNAAGGAISVIGGAGAGTGAGGALVYTGGASGAGATGNGGAVTVTGGAALSTDGTGGAISLVTGAGNGTGLSGAVNINSGTADSGAATGVISVVSGNATAAASGTTLISTGTTTTSGTTGVLTLSSGASAAASGAVSLVSGTATTGSASGLIAIRSGTSGTGTTGAISILSGNATGAGTSGNVIIDVGTVVAGTLGSISIGATSATTVSIGNSGTTVLINSGTPAANGVAYSTDTSGTIAYTATGGAGILCLLSNAGGAPAFGSCGSGAGTVSSVTGTANQITASPTTGDVILTLPVAITAPGSLTTTTTLTATTDFNVNGNTTIGNATTDRLTVTSQILGASPLVFQGLTDDTITTTFAITDPTTPSKTITFPNATGTVAVSATSPITLSALGDIGCATCLTSGVSSVTGTANQITSSPTTGAVVVSLPVAITAPGSLTTTTTLTATTDFTVNGNTLIGNATSDTVSIFPTTLAFAKENAHTIQITDSTTGNTAGGALTIKGAAGAATNAAGGAISVTGGAGAGTGAGGAILITGGAGTGGSPDPGSTGGAISLTTGVGTGAGLSGALIIRSGIGNGTSATGVISLVTGNATSAASGATTVSTGTTTTSGTTGVLTLSTGASAAASGAISIVTGTGAGAGLSGAVNIATGTAASGIATGVVSVVTGNASSAGSGALTVSTGTTTTSGTTGAISIKTGNSAEASGNLVLSVGTAGSNSNAGAISITGANGGATQAAGTTVTVLAGNSTGNTFGGAISLTAGNGGSGATSDGGAIVLVAGMGGTSGTGGGAIRLTGGVAGVSGNAEGPGGAISLTGGAGDNLGGTYAGGAVLLTGGKGSKFGGGGAISLTSGAGGSTSGNSGDIVIDAGTVVSGTLGTVSIGATNANAVSISRSGKTTTIGGDLIVTTFAAASGTTRYACLDDTGASLINAGGTAAGTDCDSSSQRFKHDISPLTLNALDAVKSWNSVSFIYNDDQTDEIQWGFIAENLAQTNPALATYDEAGLVKGFKKNAVLSVLAKAIQELDAKVDGTTNNYSTLSLDRSIALLTQNGDLKVTGKLSSDYEIDLSTVGNIFYNDDGTFKDLYKDQVLTAQQVNRMIDEKVAIKLEDLKDNGQLIPSQQQQAEASGSAAVASANQKALDNLNALLAGTNATVETLKVTGNTNLAQTQVGGTFSQDGTFIIDYGKQLNVLGSALYLQNDSFAGDENGIILDIGAGKATLDELGNLVLAGGVKADSFTITSNKYAGSSTIAAGSSSVFIPTTKVGSGSKISITFTSDYAPATRYIVSQKQDGVGFTVELDVPTISNAAFDWFIINTQASN